MIAARASPSSPKQRIELGEVQRTLLIPLYCRAVESRTPGSLLVDRRSAEIVEHLDFDFTTSVDSGMIIACVIRTAVLDTWVRSFLVRHPAGTVVEVGAGLSTRFERMDNGRAHWIDVDLIDVMQLRRQFFADVPRRTSIAASVLDTSWLELARSRPAPYFIVAEGVLIYLAGSEVRTVLRSIRDAFDDAWVAFDSLNQRMLDAARRTRISQLQSAPLRWACEDPRELEACDLTLVESRTVCDLPPLLEARLPFTYEYWTALARVLGVNELNGGRFNMFRACHTRSSCPS
jgi:O-methyltransferase involved in polyketide biosynthesis